MDKLKEQLKPVLNFVQNKKFQNIAVIVLFVLTLFLGTSVRLQTLPNLVDPTTGDYTPLALDPYYFLRVSETLLANDGSLPEFDSMRSEHLNTTWTKEILPMSTVLIYKVMNVFTDATLNFANVLNPVIFFALGIIIFFILSWILTKNRWIALIGSLLLSVIPPYLYRTLTGFSDHEAIGMFGFFLALLFFYCGMSYLEKKKLTYIKTSVWGVLAGLGTITAIAGWGGGAAFLFMIFPVAFLARWFTKKDKSVWNYVLFYGLWIVSFLFFGALISYEPSYLITRYMVSSTGILAFFALGYTVVESIIMKVKVIPKKIKKHSEISSIVSVVILGGLFYQLFIGNMFDMFAHMIAKIVNPFGTGRVAVTVAEQKQPYLTELIAQVGKTVFYTFLLGCAIVGGKIASGIKNRKLRPLFTGSFIFFLFGILFSRVSASSVLNGENFISKALFFISFLALAGSSIYVYRKSEWNIDIKWIFIAAWMIPMLLAVRSAIRVFFAIVPFISMMAPLAIFELGKYVKKTKDDLLKMGSIVLILLLSIGIILAGFGYYKTVDIQSKGQVPSYNSDWQKAMEWVRNNTAEDSKFLHWWDYGYWVQTGGNRATFSDGGHSQGDFGNHAVGRYVLTTPFPETAKSFMKTHEITHLLIDPTDIGKYGAYSSIGTGVESDDRTSWLQTMVSDPTQIQETRNGTVRIYQGGTIIDEDLRYKDESQDIFLPARKAGVAGVILEKTTEGYSQPIGVYVYNNQQYRIPMRYLFASGELIDFESGIEATAYIYANIYNSAAGQKFDTEGALIYLSEKTKDSLVAKLYLMDDPENEYEELELVHSESPYPFPFYYQGFRGPIKIWETHTEDMEDILTHEEFKENSGEYASLDDFMFVK